MTLKLSIDIAMWIVRVASLGAGIRVRQQDVSNIERNELLYLDTCYASFTFKSIHGESPMLPYRASILRK